MTRDMLQASAVAQESRATSVDASAVVDARAVIDPGCAIGPRSVVGPGACLASGVRVGSDVVVGPNAVLGWRDDATAAVATIVEDGVRIGANATVHGGATLASRCLVRSGAVVTRPVPPRAIVEGNPASIVGYVDAAREHAIPLSSPSRGAVEPTPVRGVTLHRFPSIPDLRGSLTVGEFERDLPFIPRRYFMVFGVPSREIRGEHAHRSCAQFLICVQGSCAVVADDGHKRVEILLDDVTKGVYLPPMTWGIQYKYTPDAKLLVFASHHYDNADYIRDYAQYLELVGAGDRPVSGEELQ